MKTKHLFRSTQTRWATALLVAAAAMALTGDTQAAGKGNGGNVGGDVSGWIFTQVWFDDTYLDGGSLANGLVGDGFPYIYGEQNVETLIGRNFSISLDFNKSDKKAALRKVRFNGGFPAIEPVPAGCMPVLADPSLLVVVTPTPGTGPVINNPNDEAKDAALGFGGQDQDDTPVGFQRHVNGGLTFKDDNNVIWVIRFGRRLAGGGDLFSPCASCLVVERLPNVLVDGESRGQWGFATEATAGGTHIGYLYRDNRPPHAATELWGIVRLSFSGLIESLTPEPEPSATGYEIPEDPDLCP